MRRASWCRVSRSARQPTGTAMSTVAQSALRMTASVGAVADRHEHQDPGGALPDDRARPVSPGVPAGRGQAAVALSAPPAAGAGDRTVGPALADVVDELLIGGRRPPRPVSEPPRRSPAAAAAVGPGRRGVLGRRATSRCDLGPRHRWRRSSRGSADSTAATAATVSDEVASSGSVPPSRLTTNPRTPMAATAPSQPPIRRLRSWRRSRACRRRRRPRR